MKKALEGLAGVRQVEVDADRKEARILIEKGKYDPAAGAEALKNAGFGGGQRIN